MAAILRPAMCSIFPVRLARSGVTLLGRRDAYRTDTTITGYGATVDLIGVETANLRCTLLNAFDRDGSGSARFAYVHSHRPKCGNVHQRRAEYHV